MTDPTPLLSESNSAELKNHHHDQHSSLDEMIERCIGDFGWAQFLQAILVSLTWVFDAQQTFISVFTDAAPTWHCCDVDDYSCNSALSKSQVCQLPRTSWALDLPPQASIISEWTLECASSLITALPASSFFVGCLVGGFLLATLADSSLGRKNALLFSCLLMSGAGLLTVLSSNIWIYSTFKFLCGAGRATTGTCALVLSTELVGKRWRAQVGIIGFFCFTLGFLSLPAIAYLNEGASWRTLYLWTCVPAVFYSVLVHFFVRESPRWLFLQGRKEEFIATLTSIASPSADFYVRNLTMSSASSCSLFNEHKTSRIEVDLYSAIVILFKKRWAFRRLVAVMVVGFGVGMVYYGMPLAVGSLPFNLYWSVTLNALSELPACLGTFFVIGRLNRKSAVSGFAILSGACSIMCVMLQTSGVIQIGLELVSFFSACTSLDVLLIYTLELFPTCVRNSAVGILRQLVVLGGAFSPLLVAAGRETGGLIVSYVVFGAVIGFCGLFVICLPETRGGTPCDTIDEEENKEATASDFHSAL
ncbi:hypothetical protein RJ639_044342 [Escallonia herrerae]|uniref:Major facilitator superfamily (MFS) profile domain-containing protein n=1 Tax=Escallonia herrerae TaxID=1293975 RepID=A0AA88WDK0_9ASTE|nr:hypothetical protein RJ639_044342 [Escallonia herrerae]